MVLVPVPLFLSRQFTAFARDCVWKPTICERCDVEWAFLVVLTVHGRSHSHAASADESARLRARASAIATLRSERSFVAEHGAPKNIPCPACGWYQSTMVTRMRKAHGASWGAAGAAGIVVGTLLVLRGLTDGERLSSSWTWIVGGIFPLLGGITSLVRRKYLQRAFDPNAPGTSIPREAPSGTDDGEPYLEAITREQFEQYRAETAAQGLASPAPIEWLRGRELHPTSRTEEGSPRYVS